MLLFLSPKHTQQQCVACRSNTKSVFYLGHHNSLSAENAETGTSFIHLSMAYQTRASSFFITFTYTFRKPSHCCYCSLLFPWQLLAHQVSFTCSVLVFIYTNQLQTVWCNVLLQLFSAVIIQTTVILKVSLLEKASQI